MSQAPSKINYLGGATSCIGTANPVKGSDQLRQAILYTITTGDPVHFICNRQSEDLLAPFPQAASSCGLTWNKDVLTPSQGYWVKELDDCRVYVDPISIDFYPSSCGSSFAVCGSAKTLFYMPKYVYDQVPAGSNVSVQLGKATDYDEKQPNNKLIRSVDNDLNHVKRVLLGQRPVTSVKWSWGGREEMEHDQSSVPSPPHPSGSNKGHGGELGFGQVKVFYFLSREVLPEASSSQGPSSGSHT